jgi:hypothetical protein
LEVRDMSIKEMEDIDIRTVDLQELVDVTTIAVDESLPAPRV